MTNPKVEAIVKRIIWAKVDINEVEEAYHKTVKANDDYLASLEKINRKKAKPKKKKKAEPTQATAEPEKLEAEPESEDPSQKDSKNKEG